MTKVDPLRVDDKELLSKSCRSFIAKITSTTRLTSPSQSIGLVLPRATFPTHLSIRLENVLERCTFSMLGGIDLLSTLFAPIDDSSVCV